LHKHIAGNSEMAALVTDLARIRRLSQLQANRDYAPEFIGLPRQPTVPANSITQRESQAADTAVRAHVRRGLERNLQD
jgi:hypothetical protein